MEIVICDYSMALETFACGESLAGAKAVPTSKIFLNIQNTCSKSDLSNTGLKVKILANIVIDKSVSQKQTWGFRSSGKAPALDKREHWSHSKGITSKQP